MTTPLAPPERTRALVVGIESYPGLGMDFDVPGAIAGALSFARWLVVDHEVAADGVELWLLPKDDGDVRAIAAAAGLERAVVRRFTWAEFRLSVSKPRGAFASGQFLLVYYCGHGVISGARGVQKLVLPEATEGQLFCFETDNWLELFKASGWENYAHQLWVVDACRNKWGEAMKLVTDTWNPGDTGFVPQCALFSCGSGQSAAIDSEQGPRFTRELLATLRQHPGAGWPAFDVALRTTAARLRADPDAAQRPTFLKGDDWDGLPLLTNDIAERTLFEVLSEIGWTFERFKLYLMRTLVTHHVPGLPGELLAAVELLHDLPPYEGIPPEVDFAERVARASGSHTLCNWVTARTTPHQRAQIDQRLQQDAHRARLALWYRDDGPKPCIEGELDIIDVGGGLNPWVRLPAKPVSAETVNAVLGAWLQAVFDHMQCHPMELVVDLYLPRSMLTANAYDMAVVPLAENDESRLGEDHPALLRCTDRYKAPNKRALWTKCARTILGRLVACGDPLHWATVRDNAAGLKLIFGSTAEAAPIWLGFDPHVCGTDAPLDAALAAGLPAVVWLRDIASDETMGQLDADLRQLLRSSLEDLPGRLVQWRARQRIAAGRTVAVLLDDPAWTPAMWSAWSQPTG